MQSLQKVNMDTLTKQTMVMLLAGGHGSRLHELTHERSKPSLEFGVAYKIIDFPLSNCFNSGFKQIGVVTQYKAQSLLRHLVCEWSKFNRHSGEFLEFLPASQQCSEKWYQGTADALFQNIDFIKAIMPKYVLVLSGDHIYTMDYRDMLRTHVNSGADMTVSCIQAPIFEARGQFGVMNVDDDDRITSFEEKPLKPIGLADSPNHVLASMGNYVFNTECLIEQLQKDAQNKGSHHDFGRDIIPKLLKQAKVQAFRFTNPTSMSAPYWKDVGTVDAYWKANMDLLAERPAIDLYNADWPINGESCTQSPTKFITDKNGDSAKINHALIANACIISSAKIRNSLIFNGVNIQSKVNITDSIILPNAKIGRNVVIRKAIIDRDCDIPDDMTIGVDIKEDLKRGFRLSKHEVVLVTKDMLNRVAAKYVMTPKVIYPMQVEHTFTRSFRHITCLDELVGTQASLSKKEQDDVQ
jgi:glucose-1-phosphate adenylyltransferase